ncbi:MAG TPA: tetratricopeptide repeat protein [Terriglobales bacterium]|jgi:tetratricopeptide (TPR) repeat protein|nr:tetratricopeptide repeat protein [Terriglobales bacterium]
MRALHFNKCFCGTVLFVSLSAALAQDTHRTVRHHPAAESAPSPASTLLDQAEALLAKGNHLAALPLLQQTTAKDPKSYQAWYDLGYCQQALNHDAEALTAYGKSLEINPNIFETNLNLGLLLANSGQPDQAIRYLQAATQLQPASHPERSKEDAWLALGKLQLASKPAEAELALAEAAKLVPADPEPHLLLGELYESSGKFGAASTEYQRALAGTQGEARAQALRGLVNVSVASKQYGEAEKSVREYLATNPADAQARLLLGRLLAAQGKNEEALAQLSGASNDNNPQVLREKAGLLMAVSRDAEALPVYKQLVEENANDSQLRYQYGLLLMRQHQWPEAEGQLLAAVKLNPNLASAYGDVAIAANQNQHYDLVLKALDIRTKLLGDNPGTYFLRATALDHLRRYPEATQNYKQFLATASGKYPDEEWKARHRLIAIEKLK